MRKITVFFLIIFTALLSTAATVLVIERSRIVEKKEFAMDVQVTGESSSMGFNVDPDGFHYGTMPKGSSGKREITIEAEEDVVVSIIKKGEIGKWVENPNNFLIKEGEKMKVGLILNVPENAAAGNYSGKAVFILRKNN
ncbi:hypothetical protein GF323_00780 [Candidatus Woesearchaeota archaeon]|nr:hypothetical protein [Candidatus Woesearchaeota archaeon]